MSTDTSTTTVALRPWPARAKQAPPPEEVWRQVDQLADERGYLRFITEQSLQDEIENGQDSAKDVMEGVEGEERKETQTKEERLQEIAKARMEMTQKLSWANFFACNALDLIALILSRDPAKKLDNAFSTAFKSQNIPRGSFGVQKVGQQQKKQHELDRDRDEEEKRKLAARGSRMQTLDLAVDDILKAAAQLETEVRKETKYWDDVLSISNKGWSVARARRDARNAPYFVRYGLPEASDHFKGRGLAPLHMDSDGSIILDPALKLQAKTLRVRISDDGKITGTSTLPTQTASTDLAIESAVRLARDSLFEEEMCHEMAMETRQLSGYGIELRNSVIHVPVPSSTKTSINRQVLIDSITRDDEVAFSEDHSQNRLAQNISEALRLLMVHEHHMRLFRRSQIQPPLTQHKRPTPSPPLLRTLMAMFGHINAVDVLQKYMRVAVKTLGSAGLNVSLHFSRETSWENISETVQSSSRKGLSAVDQLLQNFVRPFNSLATLTLPSANGAESERLIIATRTFVGPPTFGAEYKVTLPPSLVAVLNLSPDQKREFKFSSADEVNSYVGWILSMDLTQTLLFREWPRKNVIKSKDPKITIALKDGKKRTGKDVTVTLEQEKLTLIVRPTTYLGEQTPAQIFSWTGAPGEVSLLEKAKSFVD